MNNSERSYSDHISQKLNHELVLAHNKLQEMASLVLQQTQKAVQALIEADRNLARDSILLDRRVNAMEVSIGADCERILALYHPAASDLRLVIAITRAVTDLERIGDEAVKIARRAIDLCEEGNSLHGDREIRHIGDSVCIMLRTAMRAFNQQDADLAHSVVQADLAVDREYNASMRELISVMVQNPHCISRVMKVMCSLRAVERIGDHARNIALAVPFVTSGVIPAAVEELVES